MCCLCCQAAFNQIIAHLSQLDYKKAPEQLQHLWVRDLRKQIKTYFNTLRRAYNKFHANPNQKILDNRHQRLRERNESVSCSALLALPPCVIRGCSLHRLLLVCVMLSADARSSSCLHPR